MGEEMNIFARKFEPLTKETIVLELNRNTQTMRNANKLRDAADGHNIAIFT